jgi:hypothetical protein
MSTNSLSSTAVRLAAAASSADEKAPIYLKKGKICMTPLGKVKCLSDPIDDYISVPSSTTVSAAAAPSAVSVVGMSNSATGTVATRGRSRSKNVLKKGKLEKTFSDVSSLPGMAISEKMANQVWTHVETQVDLAFITTSNAGAVFAEHTVTLSGDVNDYTSLIAIFDQYRCTRVQFWLVPRIGPAQITAAANTGLVASVVDYDDAGAPTFAQLLEYRNVLVGPGSQGHYRDFKPHTAMAVYAGAFTSFANMADEWLDCASSGIYYYGVKTGFEVTDSAYIYDAIIRTTWEFRNQR